MTRARAAASAARLYASMRPQPIASSCSITALPPHTRARGERLHGEVIRKARREAWLTDVARGWAIGVKVVR